jgi:drug/metabolite transporter (DMT)-like permease
MALLLVLWGSLAAVTKLSLGSIDSYQLQFFMFWSALLAMTVWFASNGTLRRVAALTKHEMAGLALLGLPSYLYYFFYTRALSLLPAVEAAMLNYLWPVAVVFFATLLNKEPLSRGKAIGLLLGLSGAIIVLTGGALQAINPSNPLGDLLAVLAALSWGLFSALGKKNRIDPDVSNYVFVATSALLSTLCLFLFSEFTVPDANAIAGCVWLGISSIVLGYYIWFRVLKSGSAATAASMAFVTPFVTLLFIVLLTGEVILASQFAGLLVILLGVFVQARENAPVKDQ